jgi:ubiquinone/menaquinone biosynthesis C-methylase UbiE
MPQLARRNAILSLEQWETYYRGGALSTCPTAPDGGYDREVREAWVEFFSALRDGAHVLDIGTGNGVVALIAADTAAANGRTFQIHGTDLARIDPVRHVEDGARRFSGISFYPGVATEALPFDAASFDAVSGHYALEYAEPVAALAAIHRVLKPGGVAQFVMHHARSALIRSAHLSLREANWLFSEAKVYRKLHKVVMMEQTAGKLTQPAAIAANELRATIQALKQSIEPARRTGGGRVLSVALDAVQKLLTLRQRVAPETAGLEVDRAEQELRASVRRLNDLVGHARSDEDMARLEALATEAGFEVVERALQMHAGNNLVGWRLRLRKP